jgi:hypothetical protein
LCRSPRRFVDVNAHGGEVTAEPRLEETTNTVAQWRARSAQRGVDRCGRLASAIAATRKRLALHLFGFLAGSTSTTELRGATGYRSRRRCHAHDPISDLVGLTLQWIVYRADLKFRLHARWHRRQAVQDRLVAKARRLVRLMANEA